MISSSKTYWLWLKEDKTDSQIQLSPKPRLVVLNTRVLCKARACPTSPVSQVPIKDHRAAFLAQSWPFAAMKTTLAIFIVLTKEILFLIIKEWLSPDDSAHLVISKKEN